MNLLSSMKKPISLAAVLIAVLFASASAQITPGGVDLQPPNSALAEEVYFFHNGILMPIITVISLFVLALLLWVMLRYNSKANPNPRKFSHNTLIEIVWTLIPIIILLVIALPSFELLYKEDVIPDGRQTVARGDGATTDFAFANDFPERRMVKRRGHLQVLAANAAGTRELNFRDDYRVEGFGEPEVVVSLNEPLPAGDRLIIRGGRSTQNASGCPMAKRYFDRCPKEVVMAPTVTIKAIGYQWGWTYSYPDFGDFEFTANMLSAEETTPDLYLRAVDNNIVVPVGETIRITTTSRDVIHAWALPAFAIKIDSVPGRINETWFQAEREGVFYGQCSELCGVKHAFMPIGVEVVSRPVFEAWVDSQRALAGLEPMFETENDVKLAQAKAAAVTEQK